MRVVLILSSNSQLEGEFPKYVKLLSDYIMKVFIYFIRKVKLFVLCMYYVNHLYYCRRFLWRMLLLLSVGYFLSILWHIVTFFLFVLMLTAEPSRARGFCLLLLPCHQLLRRGSRAYPTHCARYIYHILPMSHKPLIYWNIRPHITVPVIM